ncbi:uncharacterized protein LACBIDRAFT_292147 [Laccaria bicolor S238N-H82]|uniref:Predicted protein n=1 Tax=Laccaria bicolor (strain S238N-H82 / ATCC MYA-4686) TaxID=486041 RepID=B0CUT8_LACBS|nr:uncharacterized protein LACBIDRAFT_292147 [Laccaria bicolor S238N-H82]EDR14723.1 predicted protein [Laccaria bicolor S238N-H82]|eukprot:XP_001875282.1 predicted protein [Laccaria bicolor S238N-H82]
MPLQYLPAEILDNICHHAPLPDLVALSRTSSLFYTVTQRILYRHISVDSKSLAVVLSLAKKPYVARHVRTFAIRIDPYTTVLNSYYRRLREALSNMSELTSLDISVDPTASWVLRMRSNVKFPRLQHFASSFPLDSHVAHFLCRAEAIRQLELDSFPISDPIALSSLPVTAIPQLSRFIGSSEAAQAVIPGRPVEEIHLNSGDMTEDVVRGLAKSTASVLLLGASTSSLPLSLLGTLAEFMPQLKYLRMMTTYNFLDAPDAVSLPINISKDPTLTSGISQTFYQSTANALASLRNLHSFELSGMHWGSSRKDLADEGRVWQSQPLEATPPTLDVVDLSDVYFAY